MRPDSTSLAPVTHARACPRCGGRLVQLEDPTCLPCGWVDYSQPGISCAVCLKDLPTTRKRFCSDGCSHRHKTRVHRERARQGQCIRCGVPANGRSYCPQHVEEVAEVQLDWRTRRLAAGQCLRCPERRVTARHCEEHRREHNAHIAVQ